MSGLTVGVTHFLLACLQELHVVENLLDHVLQFAELDLHGLELLLLGQLDVVNGLGTNLEINLDRTSVSWIRVDAYC